MEGDIESFRFIIEKYERPIVRMIRNIINNRQSCEDIAQDVFFSAYRKLASFDPARISFSTWLFTIARNKSINAIKKKRPLAMSGLPRQKRVKKKTLQESTILPGAFYIISYGNINNTYLQSNN
jgi:RNA polymerase sigma-70 factor (ECF subfamily)